MLGGRYSKAAGAFLGGAVSVGIGANFLESLTAVEMHYLAPSEDILTSVEIIMQTVNGLLLGGISAAVGAYLAPPNSP